MELIIDEKKAIPKRGQTLLELVRELGLDSDRLSRRPLAAKIAGEVFTLNYIPVREEAEHDSPRDAMAASSGKVELLYFRDESGRDAYIRTAQFVIFLAIRQLWPRAVACVRCTLGASVYIHVTGAEDFSVEALEKRVGELISQDIPLIRKRIPTQDAIRQFQDQGQADKARLLAWSQKPYFDVYSNGDFQDYYFGEMLPSTGYLRVWQILTAPSGFVFVYPDAADPDRPADFNDMPHFFEVFNEGETWCTLMECETLSDLNELTKNGGIRELIRVNEALHEKRFSQVADAVAQRGAKVVLLAGPSSSGKTTSANRLATQLRLLGKKPILMSLDDYYHNRDEIQPGPDGKVDLEHINTIDVPLFRQQIAALLRGESVELPSFNFKTGRREYLGHRLTLQERTVIIVEGLHGLNPALLPENVDPSLIFRFYVSPLIPLNLDNHNRISTTYLRLLRRIIRDHATRNSSVERTLSMWESVGQGERRWIYPFQENADTIFNSSTLYELAVLKKYVSPLLEEVEPHSPYWAQVQQIKRVLDFVETADVEGDIPPTSLIREFIGGNSYYN